MNIKILSSLTGVAEKRSKTFSVGTHNGIFHSDEVIACAILCLINSDKSIYILRSRDNEMLKQCDICVDIGGIRQVLMKHEKMALNMQVLV